MDSVLFYVRLCSVILMIAGTSELTQNRIEDVEDGIQSNDSYGMPQFGECPPEKDNCQDCHLRLVANLLGNDENVFNLSRAFFPPNNNPAYSLIVNYHFYNDTIDEIHTWFWANSAVNYLFPMIVLQFLSFFFSKPQPLHHRTVYLTLDATYCLGVSNKHMELLTQRVSH